MDERRTDRTPDVTDQVEAFLLALPAMPAKPLANIVAAIDHLDDVGPSLGRPLVDQIKLSPDYPDAADVFGHHLKELRVPGTTIRILFTFGPDRALVLLYIGDKAGEWTRWYRTAIPEATRLYRDYLRDTGQD